MRPNTHFILVLVLLASCKVEKQKSSTSVSSQIEQHQSSSKVTAYDSSFQEVAIEKTYLTEDGEVSVSIHPIGDFTLTPDGTFTGQAASVETKRKYSKQENKLDSSALAASVVNAEVSKDTVTTLAMTNEDTEELNVERKPSFLGWWVGLIILAGIAGVAYYLYKRFIP